jgi:hypothetical protein
VIMKVGFLIFLSIYYANSAHSFGLDDRKTKLPALLGYKPNSEIRLKERTWARRISDQRSHNDRKNNLVKRFPQNVFGKREWEPIENGKYLKPQEAHAESFESSNPHDIHDSSLRDEDDIETGSSTSSHSEENFLCLNLKQTTALRKLLMQISKKKFSSKQNFEEYESPKANSINYIQQDRNSDESMELENSHRESGSDSVEVDISKIGFHIKRNAVTSSRKVNELTFTREEAKSSTKKFLKSQGKPKK